MKEVLWYLYVGAQPRPALLRLPRIFHCDEPIRHVVMAVDNDAARRGLVEGWRSGLGSGQWAEHREDGHDDGVVVGSVLFQLNELMLLNTVLKLERTGFE